MTTNLLPDLGDMARLRYRDAFTRAVAEHRRRPLVLPYGLLGPMALAPLWLAIPHTKRPWVYRSRWLIVGLVVVLDLDMVFSMSSHNVACAYGAGLMAMWGILTTLDLLVWSRPQFNAARAVLVPKSVYAGKISNGKPKTSGEGIDFEPVHLDGLRQRRPDCIAASGLHVVSNASPSDDKPQHDRPQYDNPQQDNPQHEGPDCIWQPFPEDGPFLQRLNWAMDFVTNYRCIGWNCSIPSVPLPQIPARIHLGDPVSLDGIPVISRSGYRRSLTKAEFFRTRIWTVVVLYLVLDFLAVFMMKDPYFIFGPDRSSGHELPEFLGWLPSWALLTYRELFSLAGVFAAIGAIFNIHDIFQYYVFSLVFPIRAELWQYTTTFGSFSQVLDRGLAGWWGSWWHQTFRLQFSSPATYLVRNGYLSKGTLVTQIVTMVVSFFQSGLLHASGSQSSMPRTKVWRSPAFFLLQPPGIMIQLALNWVIDTYLPRVPVMVRQGFNLVLTLAWLQLTARLFCDDMASTGLWLLEPIPFSPFRLFGFGHPNDHWWRWNWDMIPVWHSDDNWWASGLQI
ncbi:hypothetical protein B0J13DRAFT_538171 [Dactylonectria estremocensis]|uniref:Wax synthase domain-containing protein n=1 Tax=Dactylonectria estremocensis TaxID=1079267 RepID=A0A9P9FK77_9HYPO|nr:hypothetical protein B0J13DRAFT_538171 [Dactylonectria estremocensis]